MRIMLVSLPQPGEKNVNQFPLGIGYLIGALKNAHEVEAWHFDNAAVAQKELIQKVKAFSPDIVGLTCTTFNRGSVRAAIKKIKSLNDRIKVVVGGVHASYCYDQIIKNYGADIVVIGEGEITFPKLCAAMENNSPLEFVKGIAFMNKNGQTVLNPRREPIQNLDSLPLPDQSYARPFMEKLGMGFIITSRGCPVRCSFCSTSSFWGQHVRMNSVARVVDEMELMIKKYAVKKIFFYDDTFNLGVDRVVAICDEINTRGLKVEWACSCRVVPVTKEMLEKMVAAGCRHICWGIESGSEEILQGIGKKILLSQVREAFELSSEFRDVMSTGAFTMVGNEGESAKTIGDSVDFLNTLPLTDAPSTAVLCVLPGTVLYQKLKNAGYINDTDWVKRESIPMYTVENSFTVLNQWQNRVTASGKRIPFDHEKHFWSGILNVPNKTQKDNALFLITQKFFGVMTNPKKIMAKLKTYLPAKKQIYWH